MWRLLLACDRVEANDAKRLQKGPKRPMCCSICGQNLLLLVTAGEGILKNRPPRKEYSKPCLFSVVLSAGEALVGKMSHFAGAAGHDKEENNGAQIFWGVVTQNLTNSPRLGSFLLNSMAVHSGRVPYSDHSGWGSGYGSKQREPVWDLPADQEALASEKRFIFGCKRHQSDSCLVSHQEPFSLRTSRAITTTISITWPTSRALPNFLAWSAGAASSSSACFRCTAA